MSEVEIQMLQDLWRVVSATQRTVERLSERMDSVEVALAQLDRKLNDRFDGLSARLDRSDLVFNKHAQQMADELASMSERNNARFERLETRLERVEAKVDAIDGRLVTLTATVTLHELHLREAK